MKRELAGFSKPGYRGGPASGKKKRGKGRPGGKQKVSEKTKAPAF